jgi:hypothetical protein
MSGVEPNPGPIATTLKFGLLNTRSMVNKAALIHNIVNDHKLDMLAVTETWVYEDSPDVHKQEAAPDGYSIVHAHRPPAEGKSKSIGGGIALIYRDNIQVKVLPAACPVRSFELLLVKIINSTECLRLAIIYRPPSTRMVDFIMEFTDLFASGILGPKYIVCGDLNCPGPPGTRGLVHDELLELINSQSLCQHVITATHQTGNILDHILTPDTIDIVRTVEIEDVGISDHSLIKCTVLNKVHYADVLQSTFRNWKKLDVSLFREKLLQSSCCVQPSTSADQFNNQLEADITCILDELVPFRTNTRRQGKSGNKWLSPEAVAAKQTRRRLERRWKTTRQESDRLAYRAACRSANRLINDSRKLHCAQAVKQASHDPRCLWRTVKRLLHPSKSSKALTGLCTSFCSAFSDKIRNIKLTIQEMKAGGITDPLPEENCETDSPFCDLLPVTTREVLKALNRLPNKTSPLDYLHTSVLKSCADVMAPLIAHLANLSFSEGKFPTSFKLAQVTPLVKKCGLDESDPKNYRPISNLQTIGKVIERLFLARILPCIAASGRFSPLQSAYRKRHSTETALLKITDDLYRIIDGSKAAVLIGLDLSAAFDTIDHATLVRRLGTRYGISGVVLNWIRSYLEGRHQYVKIGQETSATTLCESGVPQGSVLGPFLFSVYVSPISDIIASYDIQFHQYADDTQLYLEVKSGNDDESLKKLEMCTRTLRDWFLHNGMLLNPEKSEALLVAGRAQVKKFTSANTLSVAGTNIPLSVELKSLGVTLDQHLSFDQHVRNVVKTSNFHIRGLRHIRPVLDERTANTICCSIVNSRLDYCNSLLYGSSAKNLDKLQKVQNTLARVVSGARRRDHIKPVLKKLHWLPVRERIKYKIALISQKVISTRQPEYLADIVNVYQPTRQLRSSSQQKLTGRSTKTSTGDRAFSCASKEIWNTLPPELRIEGNTKTFKSKLKTFLFTTAFCM